MKALGENLDWVAVMTYDFHGQWDKKTGHVAPLYFHPDDDFFFFNAVRSSDLVCKYKFRTKKLPYLDSLVLGLSHFGNYFELPNVVNDIAIFSCAALNP